MQCSCPISSCGGDADYYLEGPFQAIHNRSWRCLECNSIIPKGTAHMKWLPMKDDIDEGIVKPQTFRVCLDCFSVHKYIACESPIGRLWETIEDWLDENDPWKLANSALSRLTPGARADLLSMMQDAIDRIEREEAQP